MRRWKLEKPHEGQVQSPGRGRFLLGGNGVRISAARSRTRAEDGDTSMAFSFNALPFMHRLSAACGDREYAARYRTLSPSLSVSLYPSLSIFGPAPGKEKKCTDLFVRREDGKARPRRLVLIRCPERPKGDGPPTVLGEPALELRLRRVVRKTAHVEHLAPFRQECSDVGPRVHGSGEDVGMLVRRLRFPD